MDLLSIQTTKNSGIYVVTSFYGSQVVDATYNKSFDGLNDAREFVFEAIKVDAKEGIFTAYTETL